MSVGGTSPRPPISFCQVSPPLFPIYSVTFTYSIFSFHFTQIPFPCERGLKQSFNNLGPPKLTFLLQLLRQVIHSPPPPPLSLTCSNFVLTSAMTSHILLSICLVLFIFFFSKYRTFISRISFIYSNLKQKLITKNNNIKGIIVIYNIQVYYDTNTKKKIIIKPNQPLRKKIYSQKKKRIK